MNIPEIKKWVNLLPTDIHLKPSIILIDIKGSINIYELTLESTPRPLVKVTFTFEVDMDKLHELASQLQTTPSPFPGDEDFRILVEKIPDAILGCIWEFTGTPTDYQELAKICVDHRGLASSTRFGF